MAGIRLRHPTLRGGLYLVKHYRRYPVPMVCPTCNEIHYHKTYHLNLDGEGCVTVSSTVLERLKEIGLAGLEVLNEVKRPPPITLNIPGSIENRFRVFEMGTNESGVQNG